MAIGVQLRPKRARKARDREQVHSPAAVTRPPGRLHRFTVGQFQKMIAVGIFPPGERVELLGGIVLKKMTQNPPHAVALDLAQGLMRPRLPPGWFLREQKPIVAPQSLPEPDLAAVRGPATRYVKQHPRPADIGLLIEVADSSLDYDRSEKGRVYAQAKVPVYWIINLLELKVEVYTVPKGGKLPGYQHRKDYALDESVPIVIEGKEIATIAVRDFFVLQSEHA
jgi:Uma2 family endonuclease